MAGAGYKLFNTGDVLTAAQVNTYLQEQTVMVFANSTARTTALSSVLAEGMMSYLQDTNSVEVYNGTSWVNVGNAGDITEVQAGTGISVASGTGPIPVITNTVATAFDAAGDLVYGTGADTFTKLALGTANQVLTVNSGATAPEWKTPAGGGGKVLQVVSTTYSTVTTSTSTTWADSGLTLSITPTLNTSKVLALVTFNYRLLDISQEVRGGARLLRGSTQIYGDADASAPTSLKTQASGATAIVHNNYVTWSYLDSPATTSSTTYKVQIAVGSTGMEFKAQFGSQASAIVLMEIGA